MDVAQLTDAELRDALNDQGVSVGPIVATTRKLYEKKLLKLISNDESHNKSAASQLNGSKPQNNGNDASFSPIFRNQSPAPVTVAAEVIEEISADGNNEVSDSDYEGEESMRYLTEEEMAADRAYRQAHKQKDNTIWSNVVAFSFVFVLLSVFAYFVLENAEQIKKLTEPKSDDII